MGHWSEATRPRNASAAIRPRTAIARNCVAIACTLVACAQSLVVRLRGILSLDIQGWRKIERHLLGKKSRLHLVRLTFCLSPPGLICGGSSGWFSLLVGIVMVM